MVSHSQMLRLPLHFTSTKRQNSGPLSADQRISRTGDVRFLLSICFIQHIYLMLAWIVRRITHIAETLGEGFRGIMGGLCERIDGNVDRLSKL